MHERRKPAWPQFKECRSEAGEGGWQGARVTCTVSEVPSCLGMMRVQIWKQAFFSSRTPARMPQLSTPLRVLEAAYLVSQCMPQPQAMCTHMRCQGKDIRRGRTMHTQKRGTAIACMKLLPESQILQERSAASRIGSRVYWSSQGAEETAHFRNSSMSAMETCTSRMPRFSGAGAPGWSVPSGGTTSTALSWLHTSPGSGARCGGGRCCTCTVRAAMSMACTLSAVRGCHTT